MNILVCICHVPDTTTKIKFTGTELDKNGVQFIIGPYDDYALARAVELKEASGGTLTVLNVGEADTEPTIRKALAIGADKAVRINANPKDAYFVSEQIAVYAKDKNFDMILMGREASDYNGGQVHGMVAEMLDMPCIVPCMTLEVNGTTAKMGREIEGGKEYVECEMPFVAGCQEPIAEWKIPNMRGIMMARQKPLEVIEPTTQSAPTEVVNYELPPSRGNVKMIDADNMDELVRLLKEEAKVL